jgi:hypothetical protein
MGGGQSVILQLRNGKFVKTAGPLDYGESTYQG